MARAVTESARPAGAPASSPATSLRPWAGLIAGPACWFGQQVLFFVLARPGCGGAGHRLGLLAIWAVLGLVLAAAGVLSWRAGLRPAPTAEERTGFVGFLGAAGAALFLLVMTWQAVAALTYSGCER